MTMTAGLKLVHALHGIGSVDSVEEKEILGTRCRFAIISFERLNIMVNLDQKNSMVRPTMTKDEMEELMGYMEDVEPELPSYYNKRYAVNLEKLKSGEVKQLAEVVKSLISLSTRKKLGMKDQRMLDKAMDVFVSELCYVAEKSEEEVREMIQDICTRKKEVVVA